MKPTREHAPAVQAFTQGLEPVELSAAILLYGGAQPRYARLHPVNTVDGRHEIAAQGHALTADGLLQACTDLLGHRPLQFIEPNVLALREGFQAWWRPPGPARVLIRCAELGPARRAEVPMPGLVFASRGSHVYIVAVAGRQRPRSADRAYVAPLFNHYEDGSVCNGSVRFEPGLDPHGIERLYWGSWFTAPNHRARHTLHRDGFYALWRDLLRGRWKRFPEATLAPFPGAPTLGDFLKGICHER